MSAYQLPEDISMRRRYSKSAQKEKMLVEGINDAIEGRPNLSDDPDLARHQGAEVAAAYRAGYKIGRAHLSY